LTVVMLRSASCVSCSPIFLLIRRCSGRVFPAIPGRGGGWVGGARKFIF